MTSPIILTLNLMEDSILLNEGVLDALDWPRQVQIMINQEAKMLLLRACSMEDKQAVVIPAERVEQFEISGRALLKKIRHMEDVSLVSKPAYLQTEVSCRSLVDRGYKPQQGNGPFESEQQRKAYFEESRKAAQVFNN